MWRGQALAGCAAVFGVVLLVTGCKKATQYAAPPPATVTVAKAAVQKITRYPEATGNTAAVLSVDLVARVQGCVEGTSYTDGNTKSG